MKWKKGLHVCIIDNVQSTFAIWDEPIKEAYDHEQKTFKGNSHV
jgi:hypothetical protein